MSFLSEWKKKRHVKLRITMPNGFQSLISVMPNDDREIRLTVNNDGSVRVEGGWTA